MDHFIVAAEVVDGRFFVQAAAEQVAPDPVDVGLGEVVVLDDVIGQELPAGLAGHVRGEFFTRRFAFFRLGIVFQKGRFRRLQLTVATLEENAAFFIHGVFVAEGHLGEGHHVVVAGTGARRRVGVAASLAEVGVHAPEVALHPFFVERVIVALGALRLQAGEEACDPRGDRHGVHEAGVGAERRLLAEVVQHEVHGPVFIGRAVGADE